MSDLADVGASLRILLTAAALVVIVAGLQAAASIFVPFVLAVFLSIIAAPLLFWLTRARIPSGLAVTIVVTAMVGVLTVAGSFMATSANRFFRALPGYENRLQQGIQMLLERLSERGIEVSGEVVLRYLDPNQAMSLVATILSSVGNLLTNTFLILFMVIFILLEASSFPDKLRGAFRRPEIPLEGFKEFTLKLNRYVAIKTLSSLATGVLVWGWTSICGVEFSFLWGVLAFLLNYIPSIGSIFAAVPALIVTLLSSGLAAALLVAIGYLVINTALGSFLEPRFLGRGLGLSPLIVFLSLVFWAWVLGPIGMLLAVPLTMTLKIALQSHDKTRWAAVLLGDQVPPPLKPPLEGGGARESRP
jgi:AI-2 transport protein TqsA